MVKIHRDLHFPSPPSLPLGQGGVIDHDKLKSIWQSESDRETLEENSPEQNHHPLDKYVYVRTRYYSNPISAPRDLPQSLNSVIRIKERKMLQEVEVAVSVKSIETPFVYRGLICKLTPCFNISGQRISTRVQRV